MTEKMARDKVVYMFLESNDIDAARKFAKKSAICWCRKNNEVKVDIIIYPNADVINADSDTDYGITVFSATVDLRRETIEVNENISLLDFVD